MHVNFFVLFAFSGFWLVVTVKIFLLCYFSEKLKEAVSSDHKSISSDKFTKSP